MFPVHHSLIALFFLLCVGFATTLYGGQIPPTCFSGPLPSTPHAPVYQAVMGDDDVLVEVWRESCTDGSGRVVPLIRFTPQADPPFVCTVEFQVIQAGVQYDIALLTSSSSTSTLCTTLFVPATAILGQFSTQPPFDDVQAFTLIWDDVFEDYTLEIGAAVDQVSIQQAVYFERVSAIVVRADSSLAPQAQLFATVTGCFAGAPLTYTGNAYVAAGRTCPGLQGASVLVESTFGGSASAPLK
jgi:hypothetical protein